jgi:hypothetical protein
MKFLELLVSFTIDNPLAVLGLIVIGFVLLGYELHCRFTGGYDDNTGRRECGGGREEATGEWDRFQ